MTATLARNKVVIAAGLAVALVSLLAYLVIVAPPRSRAGDLDQEITTARAELDRLRVQRARARAVKEPAVRVSDLVRLKRAMPNRTDMPGLLLQIARVARETGISFDSITPSDPVPVSGYRKVPISLVFQGNFFELNDFLYRLRNLVGVRNEKLRADGRLFAVDGIDFAEGDDQFPRIQATLTANAFVYGGGPPAAETPAPAPDASDSSAAGATG